MRNPVMHSPCACVNIRRASRAITQHYDAALKPSGLKVTQFSLLRAISRAGTAKITELADQLVLDRTTLTRNFKPLQRRRFIKVLTGEDRRVREVSLTIPGREAMERALPLWEKAQEQVRQRLGSKQMRDLLAALSMIELIAT